MTITRDPAKVTRYQEAVKRITTLQPGTPEYQKNADIIKSIGTEYGFQWQDKFKAAPTTTAPSPNAAAAASGATGVEPLNPGALAAAQGSAYTGQNTTPDPYVYKPSVPGQGSLPDYEAQYLKDHPEITPPSSYKPQPAATTPATTPIPTTTQPAATPSPNANAAASGATSAPGAPTPYPQQAARKPLPGFDADAYLKANPDVAAEAKRIQGLGDTRTAQEIAQAHWMDNGQYEGRSGGYGAAPATKDPGFNPDGTIDRPKTKEELDAIEKERVDRDFKLAHPDRKDQYGNTIHTVMNPDGSTREEVTQGAQAKAFSDAAAAALTTYDPEADRRGATDAAYGTLTKYYDRDKAREMEDQKQELANRGIPYDPAAAQDPNSKNLYGRTIGGIDQKYQGLKDDASQKAILAGNEAYGVTSSARDNFIKAMTAGSQAYGADYGAYQNNIQSQLGDNDKYLLTLTAQQLATIKGISVQEAQGLRDDAQRRADAAERERSNKANEALQTSGQAETARANAANEGLQGQQLTETQRANLANEAFQESGLSQQEAQAAIDNEIKRLGLNNQEADSLRSNATQLKAIAATAKANKEQNATTLKAAQIAHANSGGGGGGGGGGGSGASSGGGGFEVLS